MQSKTNLINLTEGAKAIIFQNSNPELLGKGMGSVGGFFLKKPVPSLKDLTQEEKAIVANNSFIQASYNFKSPPTVVFVKDSSTLEVVKNFSDLPKVALNEAQQKKVDDFLEKNKDNPNFYNGEHFAVKEMLYEATKNILYIEANATNYATMSAVPEVLRYSFFRLGVISPIITTDNQTYILERDDLLNLWSSVSGFVQPIDGSLEYLINRTAYNEFIEEVAGNPDGTERDPNLVSNILLNSISFRALHSSDDKPSIQIPTGEFIAPIHLKINSKEFEDQYLHYNSSKNRREHKIDYTKTHILDGVEYVKNNYHKVDLFNLDSILETLYSGKVGNFLCWPIVTSALSSVGINITMPGNFEQITKILPEELAEELLFNHSYKGNPIYSLTTETPHLSAIVMRILTSPEHWRARDLTDEIVKAAIAQNDEFSGQIDLKWRLHKLNLTVGKDYGDLSDNFDLEWDARVETNYSKQYQILTPETPNLSAIVRKILETQSIDRQREVLTNEIVKAALAKNDEHYASIKELWLIYQISSTEIVDKKLSHESTWVGYSEQISGNQSEQTMFNQSTLG